MLCSDWAIPEEARPAACRHQYLPAYCAIDTPPASLVRHAFPLHLRCAVLCLQLYIDQYAPMVFNILEQYLQPDSLCSEIGICSVAATDAGVDPIDFALVKKEILEGMLEEAMLRGEMLKAKYEEQGRGVPAAGGGVFGLVRGVMGALREAVLGSRAGGVVGPLALQPQLRQ